MVKSDVKIRHASFQTEGRLLQELGERLVAKADVALMELIKNSYDADAALCTVRSEHDRLVIEDDGHGMTEQEFLNKWMHIATPDKQQVRRSRQYKRTMTGSKGIGRFAVRFLGRRLRLETIAQIGGKVDRSLLTVDFDWEQIDQSSELNTVRIPYEVRVAPNNRAIGTTLIITDLRTPSEDVIDRDMRTELLSLVNPYFGLDGGNFGRRRRSKQDPGFNIVLPGIAGEGQGDLASSVVNSFYARVTINHNGKKTHFHITHRDGRTLLKKIVSKSSHITNGFCADIRYFPRRAGMFQNTDVDGHAAWKWIRDHGGIGVVDHGFRIRPYGFEDDDWLNLSWDSAHSRRNWRSVLMGQLFPIPPEGSQPRNNPMLYLPKMHQLIGAVFVVSSQKPDSRRPTDLTPSMDREGFVDNEGYQDLHEIVRAGLEMLAYADHREQRRLEEARRKEETKRLRSDLRKAAEYIKSVPGLSDEDRGKVVSHFTQLSKELSDVEDYYQLAFSKLDIMGLLGVVAGFVTHEMQRMLNGFEKLIHQLKRAYGNDSTTQGIIAEVQDAHSAVVEQLDFSTAFIGALQDRARESEEVKSRAAIELVTHHFRHLADERGIDIAIDVKNDVTSPPLPRALYTGVILNLYTNALKATMGGEQAQKDAKVVLKAWNEPRTHVIEVADTGVGIPPEIEKRIWDPLFTTTSSEQYNPLGSGMGLGLALVKKVVSDIKGRIALVDPPPGFTTCFRVEFRR